MEAIDLKKLDTAITYVQRIAEGNNPVNNMPAENDAVAISKFVGQINELIDENIYQKLCYKQMLKWLKLHGFLTEELSRDSNKKITLPTEKGVQLGIRSEERSSARGGDYKLLIYGKQAQEYIVRNMEAILKGESAD